MDNTVEPLFNNILVKPIERKSVIVSQNKSFCDYGEVIAVGDEVQKVKVGWIIGYTVWGINHLEIDGKKHYLVPEDSRFILGKITMSGKLAS